MGGIVKFTFWDDMGVARDMIRLKFDFELNSDLTIKLDLSMSPETT
jgi:hypothetical protein